jgi:hypothetical protein
MTEAAVGPSRETVVTALYYGFVALLVGGGAGVWLPLLIPDKHVGVDALATYIFAILAPVIADGLMFDESWKKLSKRGRMRLLSLAGVAGALAVVAVVRDGKSWDWTTAVAGTVLALIAWALISIYSGRFEPDPPAQPAGSIGATKVNPDKLPGGGLS